MNCVPCCHGPKTGTQSPSRKLGQGQRNPMPYPSNALLQPRSPEGNPGRAHRDMVQGRYQPNPPPSHNIGRMVSTPCRRAVRTTRCWGMERSTPPTVTAAGKRRLVVAGSCTKQLLAPPHPVFRHIPENVHNATLDTCRRSPGTGHLREAVCPTRGACAPWLRLYPGACRQMPPRST